MLLNVLILRKYQQEWLINTMLGNTNVSSLIGS